MKKVLAMLLCLSMLLGLVPALALAEEPAPQQTIVTAQELPGFSRLESLELPKKESHGLYADDELVTVIVEFTDAPLISGFQPETGSSVGMQVSQYLTAAAPRAEAMKARQDDIVSLMAQAAGQELTVKNRFVNAVNAVSLRIPYGKLDAIRAVAGVRNAYVQRVYDRPVTTSGTAIEGKFAHSYNMTGLGDVWAQGFTGQGMLVAVMDTGLDLNYTTWGDFQTGIRRVHEAFTEASFKSELSDSELRYTNGSLARFLQTTQLMATTGIDGQKITYGNNDLYKNRKVPYAADYADGDLNVMPAESDHGTHVAGTIAGYAETEEGEVIFSGVAPDAQFAIMKVFPDSADSGAEEGVILAALEDALLLGVDVVNLSLGSDNGWADDDTAANHAYQRLNEAGITFMVSAGNSGDSAMGNHYGDRNLTADPETSMISSPAVYASGLAVASMENDVAAQSILFWQGTDGIEHKAAFSDPFEIAMKSTLGEGSWKVIPVEGYGTADDYYNAGFRNYTGSGEKGASGIALVRRGGGISFVDKINAATQFTWSYYDPAKGYYVTEFPVKAVIIYDEDPTATELIYMSADSAMLTSCFISGQDGHALYEAAKAAMAEGKHASLRVSREDEIVQSADKGKMSVFSSWGAGPALELKPEITAPGGNIWSAIIDTTFVPANPSGVYDDYVGDYGMMSGTSMAAPHMSGLALLVRQAVVQNWGITSKLAVADLSEHLLVSTAVPQLDENGIYYSPRYQGAGLVNVSAAVSTPAFISVEGQTVGKLELKDDPQRTGVYNLTFQVNNLSDRDVTYSVAATLTRPDTDVFESQWGNVDVALDRNVLLLEEALGTVTVPAGQTVTVTKTVELTSDQKAEMDEKFPNGTYVEGFISLTSENEPTIGLPVLAFYGDWTAAPIFDRSVWYETPADGENLFNNPSTMGNTFVGDVSMSGYINLGQNAFDPTFGNQCLYHTENFAISPNGDGVLDGVTDFVLYQLREAKLVVVQVHDAETGELYYSDWAPWQFKSLYYAAYGYAIPASQFYFTETAWRGTDLEGNTLPTGTNCVMTITAWGDGDYGEPYYEPAAGRMVTNFDAVASGEIVPTFNGHEMDLTGDVLQFPITIDTVAPKLENNTVSFYHGKDGRTYMTGTVYDVDGSIASVEVHPYVKRTHKENPDYFGWDIDQLNPFYSEHVYDPATKTLTFTCDVTEYAHTNESWPGEGDTYDFEWEGTIFLSCGDYGLNDRTYTMKLDTGDGLLLSQTSALMYEGGEFELSVIDNTGIDGELIRTSSNPEVATIDEFGTIRALAPGQATISIAKGDVEAVCVVAVRERSTEIIDFDLSIEHFSGLKPDGSVIVKVINLQPANVKLEEVRWEINEDDPDLYVGLVNVARYDTTGLTGEIFLNYTATGDPAIHVPGASGTLDVTLNGVTRSMHIDWTDLYTYEDEDDLVSDLPFYEQTMYITQGQTATLSARYSNAALHEASDVKLYTAENYVDYDYNNSTKPAVGLKLDGPDFSTAGNVWSGRLVNAADFALPERIRVFNRYSSGYEYEMTNSWRVDFDYDPTTGEINVYYPPESSTSELVIRADGVYSMGTRPGKVIGGDWQRPEPVYGPFDWEIVSGNGELTVGSTTDYYGTEINCAWFEPSEPGTSIIRATTKDGSKSVCFAVVSEAVLAEKLSLSQKNLTLSVGQTGSVEATLTPTPTLAQHAQVKWQSFNPDVATVDENGTITAHAEGYAYIRAYTDVQQTLETVCVVKVVPCAHEHTETVTVDAACETDGSVTVSCTDCGAVISEQIIPGGHAWEAVVTEPTCDNSGFTTYTCTVCGAVKTDDETAALGHSFEHIHVAPDCGKAGYDQYICTTCGYTYADHFQAALDCPSAAFVDVTENDWFHEAVDYVVGNGIMNGMDATHFGPATATNRAQVVTVLYRMAGSPAVAGELPFVDVESGDWFYDAVLWAYQEGIAMGMDDTHFGPGLAINRAQLVTFLYRFANLAYEFDPAVLEQFPDGAALPEFCRESFAWAIDAGLVAGMDGRINASGTANRAQLATILTRYDSLGK